MFNRVAKKHFEDKYPVMNFNYDKGDDVPAVGAEASLSMGDIEMGSNGKLKVDDEMNEADLDESKISLFSGVIYMICCFSVVISLGTMAIYPYPIVIAAMVFPLVFAPYAGLQRRILSANDGLRNILNKLRTQANDLSYQNDILKGEVEKVGQQVDKLKGVESTLSDIASSQNTDVKKLVNLVNENKKIVVGMKEMLEGEALADLMEVILISDRDEDFKIDPEEVNSLILRLRNLNGVDFNEDEFRKILETQELDINFVMLLVKDMIDDTSESKVMKVNVDKMISEKRAKL